MDGYKYKNKRRPEMASFFILQMDLFHRIPHGLMLELYQLKKKHQLMLASNPLDSDMLHLPYFS